MGQRGFQNFHRRAVSTHFGNPVTRVTSPDMLGSNPHEFEHEEFFFFFLFTLRVFGVYLEHTTGRSGAVASNSWDACLGGLTLNST